MAVGAAGCASCDFAFHERCVSDKGVCPACDEPYERFELGPPAEPRDHTRELVERGRTRVTLACAVIVSFSLLGLVTQMTALASTMTGYGVVVELVLIGLVFRGHEWARVVLAVLTSLAALATLYLAIVPLGVSTIAGAELFVGTAVYATMTFLLASTEARAFVASRAR